MLAKRARTGRTRTWNLDAKATLSELVDLANAGKPQLVNRRGVPAAAIVSIELAIPAIDLLRSRGGGAGLEE